MITSKHIEKIVAVVTAAAIVICLLTAVFSDTISEKLGIGSGYEMEYETALFGTSSVIEIDIQMDSEKWNEMLENAISEEYYQCNVVVNGETFYNVGIRPKGNTSLSTIVNDPDTNRYSFKLEFDKYVDGQTCFGLDKLVLNNNYADATNMKEAVVYDMFRTLGADASLYNYADISVNGETWGVYLALEAVESSFMLRNYGSEKGKLYKPDSMNFGGAGGMKNRSEEELNEVAEKFFGSTDTAEETAADTQRGQTDFGGNPFGGEMPQMPDMGNMPQDGEMPQMPDMGNMPQGGEMPSMPDMGNMPQGGEMPSMPDMENMPQRPDWGDMNQGGGMPSMPGRGSGGSDLNYTDDSLDSYSDIWDGEVNSSGDSDHKRVVTALKNISEQNNVEDYLDVDNMLRYMAVHTFSVNLDSLSGSMTHNYYLYEQNGKLNLLPWDYNLAFGGFSMGGGGASDTVNFPIDTPFSSGISLDDRQIFAAILENEEYLEQYHGYLRTLCEEYIDGGKLDALYSGIRSQIDELVRNDPNAFYSYDEYDAAAQMLLQVIKLRCESVMGQLNGTIPSTTDGQNADSSSLVDASSVNLSVMGTMNNGGMDGRGSMKDRNGNVTDASDENIPVPSEPISQSDNTSESTENSSAAVGNLSSLTGGPEGFEGMPPPGGVPPGGFRP